MAVADSQWIDKIFKVSPEGFSSVALEIFRYQYRENKVYGEFVNALGINPEQVRTVTDIPFLPISFFKTAAVCTTNFDPEVVFQSSGTTGVHTSRHLVKSLHIYEESFLRGFQSFYGMPSDWCILGLLPSYLERGGSSLIYMVNRLILDSRHPRSGFYLNAHDELPTILAELEAANTPTLLIGVTFALLDMAEAGIRLPGNITVMETGGMKGRRKEMVRDEMHHQLKHAFQLDGIHSEYGMTELLSQAYSSGGGIFKCPPWMRVLVRDEEDPLTVHLPGDRPRTGAVNIIDLGNIYSCCFIATDDAGRLYPDHSFEVLGRLDNSDLRGCSLLVL